MQNVPHAVGLLVHGDNHFVVRGPRPNRDDALALVRQWSVIRVNAAMPERLGFWSISTREFRENLQWAVITPGEGSRNPAVSQLLNELAARGVRIDDYSG